MLQAGVAQFEITPPKGKAMGGYLARQGGAQGVHDSLWAKALALQQGHLRIGLVSCDVVGLDLEVVRRIEHWAKQLGFDRVLVAATHTHSGPAGLTPPFDDEVVRQVEAGVIGALEAALDHQLEARFGYAAASAPGVGLNRRDPTLPLDDTVHVLRFETVDGQPIAGVMYFACHPTVLSHENLLYSADYPGPACDALQQAAGGGVMLFLNGAAGDVSTRFTRKGATFAESQRLGELLGQAAAKAWQSVKVSSDITLQLTSSELKVSPRTPPSAQEAELMYLEATKNLETARTRGVKGGELRQLETTLQGAERMVKMAKHGVEVEPFELIALRIGEVCLVSSPGEMFNAFATKLQAPFDHPVLLVGYANGRAGYLPTVEEMVKGGYEVGSTRYAPQTGDQLIDRAIELVQELKTKGVGNAGYW